MKIDFDCVLDVDYEVDTSPPEGKLYPITVKSAKFRGKDILPLMFIDHVMTVQRRVYNHLLDSGLIKEGVYSMPEETHYGHEHS